MKLKLYSVCLFRPFADICVESRTLAHELGHWYYMHPTKMLLVSQLHIFTILALFPAFMHAPPFLRSFDFPKPVAAQPPTIIAFLLFQVSMVTHMALIHFSSNEFSCR